MRAMSGRLLVTLGLLGLLSVACGASGATTPTPKPGLFWYLGEEMRFQYPKGWAVREQERMYVELEPASGSALLAVQCHLVSLLDEVMYPRPYEEWKEDLTVALYMQFHDYEGFEILREYPLDDRPVFEYRVRRREEEPWIHVLNCFFDGERLGIVTVNWLCYKRDPDTFQSCLELQDKYFDDVVRSVSPP